MSETTTTTTITLPPFCRYPPDAELKTFHGACHCKKFSYEFQHPSLDVKKPAECNCSWCTRTGAIYAYGSNTMLKLDESSAPLEALGNFTSKAGYVKHYFCLGCGLQLFWMGTGAFGGALGVNVRNFDGMKLEEITWTKADGRKL